MGVWEYGCVGVGVPRSLRRSDRSGGSDRQDEREGRDPRGPRPSQSPLAQPSIVLNPELFLPSYVGAPRARRARVVAAHPRVFAGRAVIAAWEWERTALRAKWRRITPRSGSAGFWTKTLPGTGAWDRRSGTRS